MAPKQCFLNFLKSFVMSFSWILILELWAKLLMANQIAWFFKMLYLKKEVNEKVYLWHADKHWSFLQVDDIIYAVVAKNAQSTQNKMFAYLCNISRKTWGTKLIFFLQVNTKFFYKLIVKLWVWLARRT